MSDEQVAELSPLSKAIFCKRCPNQVSAADVIYCAICKSPYHPNCLNGNWTEIDLRRFRNAKNGSKYHCQECLAIKNKKHAFDVVPATNYIDLKNTHDKLCLEV